MRKLLATATAVLAFVSIQAYAQPLPPVYVMHNESVMAVFADHATGSVSITYVQPKPSLAAIGVRPGTLLFDGAWNNGALYGRARVFNLVCGAIPYDVHGGIDPSGALVLEGPQLRVNQFCQPYYFEWTQNSVLVFTPMGGQQ